jgi:Ca-activated chloride channel family protein
MTWPDLASISLRDPAWLALALALPPIWLWRRHRGAPAVTFAPAAFLAPDDRTGAAPEERRPLSPWRVRLLPLPKVLQAAGLLLALVALARPVQREPLPLTREGVDLMLCLDVSSSMAVKDLDRQRTRLDVAKDAAIRFLRGRPDDRIGLLCFARYPDLRCPPTLDHDALEKIVAATEPVESEGPEDATGIGAAVARAAQLLQTSPSRTRVVVLLTDGEENVATALAPLEIAPIHAAQLCEQLGVRVHSIVAGAGVDAAGAGRGGARGVDTTQVRWLAERTGGRFFETRDAGAVAAVYASIDELEKSALEQPRFRTVERFLPFLAAALALLVAAHLLEAGALGALP